MTGCAAGAGVAPRAVARERLVGELAPGARARIGVAGGFMVVELFAVSKGLANANGNAVIPILIGIGLCYLIITIPLGQLAGWVERKVALQK